MTGGRVNRYATGSISLYTPAMPKRTLPRRDFLKTLSAGAVLPRAAAAGLGSIPDRVATMRQEWADLEQSYLNTLFYEQVRPAGPQLSTAARAMGSGLGAMKVFKDVEGLDVEDQAHPAMQALILEVADAVGGAIETSRVLLEGHFSGHGATDDGEANLTSALQATRYTVRDWRCTVGHQKRLEDALLDLETRPAGQLRRQARRDARDVARMERLAMSLAQAGPTTGLLTGTDPRILQRVASGARPRIPIASLQPRTILGLLALGLAFYGGVVLTIVGICAVSCGGGVGALLMGLGIMGLSVWAAVKLIQRDRAGSPRARDEALSELAPLDESPGVEPIAERPDAAEPIVEPEPIAEPVAALVGTTASITAGSGWTAAALVLKKKQPLSIEATGQVGSSAGWIATPDGNGVAAVEGAPLPGAPAAALIGRIGGSVFFVGSRASIKAPESGRLWLGINVTGSDPIEGTFTVTYAAD